MTKLQTLDETREKGVVERDMKRNFIFACVLLTCLFSSYARAQTGSLGTLQPSSLSCTRASLALGDAVLPTCSEGKIEFADSVTYYVSAECATCGGAETLIEVPGLILNIGQHAGPCTVPVTWTFSGGIYSGGSTGSYIGGTIYAASTLGYARLVSSIDCNDVPLTTGGPVQNFCG